MADDEKIEDIEKEIGQAQTELELQKTQTKIQARAEARKLLKLEQKDKEERRKREEARKEERRKREEAQRTKRETIGKEFRADVKKKKEEERKEKKERLEEAQKREKRRQIMLGQITPKRIQLKIIPSTRPEFKWMAVRKDQPSVVVFGHHNKEELIEHIRKVWGLKYSVDESGN